MPRGCRRAAESPPLLEATQNMIGIHRSNCSLVSFTACISQTPGIENSVPHQGMRLKGAFSAPERRVPCPNCRVKLLNRRGPNRAQPGHQGHGKEQNIVFVSGMGMGKPKDSPVFPLALAFAWFADLPTGLTVSRPLTAPSRVSPNQPTAPPDGKSRDKHYSLLSECECAKRGRKTLNNN